MPKHYVTFGQNHVHEIKGKLLNKNVVARYDAENAAEGRKKAFKLFDLMFCLEYHDNKWKHENMRYFPGGYVDI